MRTPPGHPVVLCHATLAEWEEFVRSEDQALKSTHMEWADGEVLIVEVPSEVHGNVSRAFNHYFMRRPFVRANFLEYGDSYDASRRRFEPDESYRPLNPARLECSCPMASPAGANSSL
ncbi:TPA: hypothetical protein N0F65_012712 [Lagenidium giganteum]|uniref:Restriction endonuclease domain-containing protein n=1 Tax=Lagenidium giganteum TaxID=4803 RepID=A0AAV2YA45_9STRA|nr:TPA: hypothetical protein N0F65_012712 [Lagenidium giganteum]